MALLYVPPTQYVTENPEAAAELRASARAYVQRALRELGVQTRETKEETRGAFRGLKVFDLSGTRDAVLYTAFLLAPEKRQSSAFLHISALVWKKDCLLAGATWEKGDVVPAGVPAELFAATGATLADALKRKAQEKNTVRWETRVDGPWASRLSLMLEAIGGERLAAQGAPVNASLSRLACKWIPTDEQIAREKNGKDTIAASDKPAAAAGSATPLPYVTPFKSGAVENSSYPMRTHRLVQTTIKDASAPTGRSATPAWPRVTYESSWGGGVFGEHREVLAAQSKSSPFLPVTLADAIARKVPSALHDVRAQSFRVVKRQGRWIFLDRGRAYGLEIGTHLQGPGNSKLHVIQFAPDEKEPDVAVALVRDEDKASPLKPGDTVEFDPTQFPPGRAPGLGLTPL